MHARSCEGALLDLDDCLQRSLDAYRQTPLPIKHSAASSFTPAAAVRQEQGANMFLMSSGCTMSELQRPAAPSQPNTHALLWLWGSERAVAACFSVKLIYIPEEVHFRMQTQHPGSLGTVQRMIKPHWRANIMQADPVPVFIHGSDQTQGRRVIREAGKRAKCNSIHPI